MAYAHTISNRVYRFADLTTLLAKATPERSGDQLAGIAAESDKERMAARVALADLPLRTFLDEQIVPYEVDEVTRLIVDTHDAPAFAPIAHLTVGGWRDWLLSEHATPDALAALAPGLTPEMVAAVSKLMRNQDLIVVARKCRVVTRFRNTLGLPGRLAVRLQPNHPTDDLRGIAASMLDGLLYGSGDAVIGINPASDSTAVLGSLVKMLAEVIERYEIPTQSCVLTHVTNTMRMIEAGVPVDLVFQSVAGTEQANKGFGINLALLREANDAARSLKRGTVGDNVMYFETGQGSALSAGAHHRVDQQTLEARAYAVAREFEPLLANTVVGFIGPEYLYNGKQIIRAGLEDHFCGKLLGLPIGCDICYIYVSPRLACLRRSAMVPRAARAIRRESSSSYPGDPMPTKLDDVLPHPTSFVSTERLAQIKGYVLNERRTPARNLPVVTPHQTIGPFYPHHLVRPGDEDLAACDVGGPRAEGEPMEIVGTITDLSGKPVAGALIEVWTANAHGKYSHPADHSSQLIDPNFKGYGRAITGPSGTYRFVGIKPGAYPNPGYDNWMRPPHVHFSVYAAGVMHRLITQMYFPGESLNDIDPILNGIDDLAARASLIAVEEKSDTGRRYRFDIVLQGEAETQFFIER